MSQFAQPSNGIIKFVCKSQNILVLDRVFVKPSFKQNKYTRQKWMMSTCMYSQAQHPQFPYLQIQVGMAQENSGE